MFSDTPSGIAPSSVPGYVVAQVIGGVLGLGLVAVLYPRDRRLTRIDIPDSLSELQDA